MAIDGEAALIFVDGGGETINAFRGYNGPMYMDGTFHITPQPFDSLLTVHLEKEGHSFPLFYVLLPSRTERIYTAVLRRVQSILTPIIVGISHVMTDYEVALMNSAANVFNNPVGCWFHFSKALLAKLKKLNLLAPFKQNPYFRRMIHKYMALPLLPEQAIQEAVQPLHGEVIQGLTPYHQRQLRKFRAYFDRFWLGRVGVGRFCVFGLSRRSNNGVESFNASLKRKVKKAHPNFFLFIQELNKVIKAKLNDLTCLQNGRPLGRKRHPEHILNENNLRPLEQRLLHNNITSSHFLTTVIRNIHRYPDNYQFSDDEESDDDDNDDNSDDHESEPSDIEDTDDDEANESEDHNDEVDQSDEHTEGESNNDNETESEHSGDENIVGQNRCPVCLVNGRNSVVNPCGHSACYDCAHRIATSQNMNNTCFECRGPILSIIRVYGIGQ